MNEPTSSDFVAVDDWDGDPFLALVGRNVRALRAWHGWTQAELGERMANPRKASSVASLENGIGGVPLAQLPHFAAALEVPVEALVTNWMPWGLT